MKLRGPRPGCYTLHFLFSRAKAASQSDGFVARDSVCSCLVRGFWSSQSCLSLDITDVEDCTSNQSMKPTPKAFASRLALLRIEASAFATTPCRGLSLSR